jgi:pyruvate,phosphate dikinase
MVFGNMGETCATGVCFTRDPSTGEKKFFGEYLVNAQGEDVVAGIRTPAPINEASKNESNKHHKTLQEVMPKAYDELVENYHQLENHYKDMQDIEFTIENNKLYILQTRNAKRTVNAALKVAVDLVSEGLITEKEAILRIHPEDLNQLLHPRLDPKAKKTVIATGLPASPGAASGQIVFTSAHAEEWHKAGKKVVLVRAETSPEDIGGMVASSGILTARGGMTSHAAVVARGMGKPCIAGCTSLVIDEKNQTLTVKGKTYKEGEWITFDGATGEVYEGIVPTIEAKITADFATFMKWADAARKLKVRTNADTPEDSKVAVEFGAEGIGLCRTEHMFFAPERILAVREMIFADNEKEYVNEDLLIRKTTYLDNSENLTSDDIDRILGKEDNYYRQVYAFGNWGVIGNVIFTNWETADLKGMEDSFEMYFNGLDFGYTNDPTALIRVVIASDGNYFDEMIYRTGMLNRDIVEMFKELVLKLAGKTSQYQESELDKILAKMHEDDFSTESGTFVIKRIEALKNKPAKTAIDMDIL